MSRFEPQKSEVNPVLAAYRNSKLGPGLGWKTDGGGKGVFHFWAKLEEREVEPCSAFDLAPTKIKAAKLLEKLRRDRNLSPPENVSSTNEVEDLRAIFQAFINSLELGSYGSIISQQLEGRVVKGVRLVFPTPVGVVRLGTVVFLKDCPSSIKFEATSYTGILYSSDGKSFHKANDTLPFNSTASNLVGLGIQPLDVDPFMIGGFQTLNPKIIDRTFYLPRLAELQKFNISFEVIRVLNKVLALSAYNENCLRRVFIWLGHIPVSVLELLSVLNIQDIYDSLIDTNQAPFTLEVPTRNFLNKDLAVGLPDTFKLRYAAEIEEERFKTLIVLAPPTVEPEKLASAIGWLLAAIRENVSCNDGFWKATNLCILYTTGQGSYRRLMIYSPEYLKNLRLMIE